MRKIEEKYEKEKYEEKKNKEMKFGKVKRITFP